MVQRRVGVCSLAGVEIQELVDEITCVRILDIGLKSLLDPSAGSFGQFDAVEQFQVFDTRPDLRRDRAT